MKKVMGILGLPIPAYCRYEFHTSSICHRVVSPRFCDPVLGERRRRKRGHTLLADLTECACPEPRPFPDCAAVIAPVGAAAADAEGGGRPGWWSAGLASLKKGPKKKRKAPQPAQEEDEEDDLPLAAFQKRPSADSPGEPTAKVETDQDEEPIKEEAVPSPANYIPAPSPDQESSKEESTSDQIKSEPGDSDEIKCDFPPSGFVYASSPDLGAVGGAAPGPLPQGDSCPLLAKEDSPKLAEPCRPPFSVHQCLS